MHAATHGSGDISFATIEQAARRGALQLACSIVETALNSNHSDAIGSIGVCPRCGGAARYRGRRPKTQVTALGEMTTTRAYYLCDQCHTGFCPRDGALGMTGGSLSPGVTRMVGMTAAMVSFAESDELLQELAGITVGAKMVERASEALGRDIIVDEQAVVTPGDPGSKRIYVGMDGTGTPMRAEAVQGRAGKQPDGTAKTREAKLVTIWTADHRDRDGTAVRDPGSVSYNGAIESAAMSDTDADVSPFAGRVRREATRRGVDKATEVVAIGDGARWIWNLVEEEFPGAIQIIDLFHAKGTLTEVAKTIFGVDSPFGAEWAKHRRDELEAGDLDAILDALQPHLKQHAEARRCSEYIRSNWHRMQYPHFRRRGLCTSTGVVEAGCKLAVGTRLKRAGMHWTLDGANEIIALRTCKLSGRYDDYCNRHALSA